MTGHLVAALASLSMALQQRPEVLVGSRVRVRVEGTKNSIAGPVTAIDERRIRIALPGAQVGLPWRSITDLSVSTGNGVNSGGRTGAFIGGILGLAVGLGQQGHVGKTDFAVQFVLAPAAGAAIGYLAGALIAPETWRAIVLDPALRRGSDAVEINLTAGSTIRVYTASGLQSGMVEHRSSDSTIVLAGYPAVSIPWRNVQRVKVRGGRNRLLGALYGFVIGAGLAAATSTGDSAIPDANANALFNASVAIGGALLGSRVLAPRTWTTLPLPPQS